MSSPYQHPPADPDLADVVARLSASLATLPSAINAHRAALEAGATLGELRGVADADVEALYQAACRLCDAGQFHHALPIALQLLAHQPRDGRLAFLCASCLQRTERHADAAVVFAVCLALDPAHAAAAYRLGECLEAMQQPHEAAQAFAQAVELCRGNFHRARLQDMAQARADRLFA